MLFSFAVQSQSATPSLRDTSSLVCPLSFSSKLLHSRQLSQLIIISTSFCYCGQTLSRPRSIVLDLVGDRKRALNCPSSRQPSLDRNVRVCHIRKLESRTRLSIRNQKLSKLPEPFVRPKKRRRVQPPTPLPSRPKSRRELSTSRSEEQIGTSRFVFCREELPPYTHSVEVLDSISEGSGLRSSDSESELVRASFQERHGSWAVELDPAKSFHR